MTVQGWPCWSPALLGTRLWPVMAEVHEHV
jgi:hypothetical protein